MARYMLKIAWVLILILGIGFTNKSATATYSLPIKSAVIVIDSGHGGRDPGALGDSGLRGKEVNLEIALKLRRLVEQGRGTAFLSCSIITLSFSSRSKYRTIRH